MRILIAEDEPDLAEAHNGSITARSEDGKTVEFTVLLR